MSGEDLGRDPWRQRLKLLDRVVGSARCWARYSERKYGGVVTV